MTQEKTTRRGVALYKDNPFIMSVQTRTKRVTNKRGDMMLINSGTGEIQTTVAGFWEAEEVDSAKFIKLFVNGVRALAELSNSGARVFELLYIEMQQNIGKDSVYLSYTALHEEVGISRSTFARGLKELIDKKFIAATTSPAHYWINPDFVWNGDRLAFVKEYRRTSSKSKVVNLNQAELFSSDPTSE